MRTITRCVCAALLLCVGLGTAVAQEMSDTTPPPKVLVVDREFVKPGKGGSGHEKSESAFVQAFARAKWPQHYFAANSMTGKNRVLFFIGYDSFEAWEKDNAGVAKNATLSAAIDRAVLSDGDLLSETDVAALAYNEDQSLRGPVDIAHMRYFEISLYRVKAGHGHEWEELVKLVKAAYEKVPGVHWAMYQAMYGQEGTTYVVIVPMKSLAEVDQSMQQDKQFAEAMGEDGMKKLGELESSAVEFHQTNLFQFNAAMSYPRDEWIKADPDFWKAKAAAKPAAKTEEKPAAKQ
jgi:hypothetical protein